MHSTWYRLPEEDGPRDEAPQEPRGSKARGRGRGRARGRARGRGRGSGRKAQEPLDAQYDAAAPCHTTVAGHQNPMPAAYAPFYYNPACMEDLLPHWQYVHALHAAREQVHLTPNSPMFGYQPYPTTQALYAGHPTHTHFDIHSNREHFSHYLARPTNEAHCAPRKAHHQPADKRNFQKHRNLIDCPITTESQVDAVTSSKFSESQAHTQQITAQKPDFLRNVNETASPAVASQGQKTLAETAAFLENPQLVLQKTKNSIPGNAVLPALANYAVLSQTPALQKHDVSTISHTVHAVSLDPPKARKKRTEKSLSLRDNPATNPALLFYPGQVQDSGSLRPSQTKDNNPVARTQMPDFRKYKELSVTLAIEPPPAHQASAADTKKLRNHPDLYTPPLAHQAPATHVPATLQSASYASSAAKLPSPPPAHQASIARSSHRDELLALCRRNASDTDSDDEGPREGDRVLGASHTTCRPNQMLGGTQILYQPSTETFASEQVMYQPQIDMFTKEQIVYQPRKKMLSKTQVVYQPRTDFIATAEAVYQPDMVAARQTVIQPKAGKMKTAQAVYNTQDNMSMRSRQADIAETVDTIYRQQADILAARQASRRPRPEVNKTTESAYRPKKNIRPETQTISQPSAETHERSKAASARGAGAQTKKQKTAPILRNILSSEQEQTESQESETNMVILQQFLQENYTKDQKSTNSPAANQTLRQTRKKKTSPAQPAASGRAPKRAAAAPAAGSSRAPSAPSSAADFQSILAMNWTLQSMSRNWEANPHYIELLQKIMTNNNTSARKDNN